MSNGSGMYKGHKESNFCMSALEYEAVISSGPCKDLGIQVAPRGSGAAWFTVTLSCQHVVLLLAPHGLSLWSISSYLQLKKCVCHSRYLWESCMKKTWTTQDCISHICRFLVPIRKGRHGNIVWKSLGWSKGFLWTWFWNILCFWMQIPWCLENRKHFGNLFLEEWCSESEQNTNLESLQRKWKCGLNILLLKPEKISQCDLIQKTTIKYFLVTANNSINNLK